MSKRRSRRAGPKTRQPMAGGRRLAGADRLLQRAIIALRRGETAEAARYGAEALRCATRPDERQVANELAAESLFREACVSADDAESLTLLDGALARTPADPRLRFHRAIALWRLGNVGAARAELAAVAAGWPDRPGLAYLHALAELAADGRLPAPLASSLTAKEVNTLRWAEHALAGSGSDGITCGAPVLGSSTAMWPALAEMRRDPTAAPVEALAVASRSGAGRRVRGAILGCLGVAWLRSGDVAQAHAAWAEARRCGGVSPVVTDRYLAVVRDTALALAQAERWRAVADLTSQLDEPVSDSILAATLAIAFDHLGVAAAQSGDWRAAAASWQRANALEPSRQRAQNLALSCEALMDWASAGDAWREMVRRRPRRPDQPGYLAQGQVAAIWRHAADCYDNAGEAAEAVTCLRTARKYAPDDLALRIALVDVLIDNDQLTAADNELVRVLDDEPDHVEALVRLATLRRGSYGDDIAIWRHALRVEPDNPLVRDGLAGAYISRFAEPYHPFSARDVDSKVAAALAEVPGHPGLLLAVADLERRRGRVAQARDLYRRAYAAAPHETATVGPVVHDLLHLHAGDEVTSMLGAMRQIPGLLPAFWIGQGQRVIECQLETDWAVRFFDEAVALAEARPDRASKAAVLAGICARLATLDSHAGPVLAKIRRRYGDRARTEVPESGAAEFVSAIEARLAGEAERKSERLMREAERKAQQHGDRDLMAEIDRYSDPMGGLSQDWLERLARLFPGGLPDPGDEADEYF